MALKRKQEFDADDMVPHNTKQLKLIPFPNLQSDEDVPMSDAEPLYPDIHHTRIPSNASSTSSSSPNSPLVGSVAYPTFDLYPLSSVCNDSDMSDYSPTTPYGSVNVRLLQPVPVVMHHGDGCSQIPKLRMACSSGLNGQRTMWSHCEQCGAISMVESD